MEKSKEKRQAFLLFKQNEFNQLEIANKLGVTQKTIGKWKREFNANQEKQKEKQQDVISYLKAIQIELKQIKELIKTK